LPWDRRDVDQRAWRRAVEAPIEDLLTHASWLRRLAGALVRGEDAADLAQETLVAAWTHPPAPDRDVRPWLAEVARNQAHDARRSDRRRQAREVVATEAAPRSAPSPEDLVGDVEIHRSVAASVMALDQPFRETVVLRYYEGLSAAEIARRLKVPAGTVRWRLKEGLDRLRAELDSRHAGERRRWVAALIPLVPRPRVKATSTWLAAGAALLVAGGAILMVSRGNPLRARWTAERARPAAAPLTAARTPRFAGLPAPRTVPPLAAPVIDPESRLRRMLTAIANNSYDDFVSAGDDQFRAVLDPDTMEEAVNALGPRLAGGYQAISLGTLHQDDQILHLWKLELGDGGDDVLIKMSLKDGQVTGFIAH
jgi:RNA polymerase sigma-70 factor (ECF subfamily)